MEKHSEITINYGAFPCEIDDEYVVDFRIRSVNGFRSVEEFQHATSEVASGFMDNLAQKIRNCPRKYRQKFGEDALDRFVELMTLVAYERGSYSCHAFYEEPEPGYFMFMQPIFSGHHYHNSAIYMDQILVSASDYAWAWWDVMADLLESLKILVTTVHLLPEIHAEAIDAPDFEKIRMRLTVPQLACFFKLFVKGNLIDVVNKTELFKSIAEVFQTKGQDNLSWRNVKNHFDSCSPDAIEFCQQEFLSLSQLASQFLADYFA